MFSRLSYKSSKLIQPTLKRFQSTTPPQNKNSYPTFIYPFGTGIITWFVVERLYSNYYPPKSQQPKSQRPKLQRPKQHEH